LAEQSELNDLPSSAAVMMILVHRMVTTHGVMMEVPGTRPPLRSVQVRCPGSLGRERAGGGGNGRDGGRRGRVRVKGAGALIMNTSPGRNGEN
jgi:hypothetical protein